MISGKTTVIAHLGYPTEGFKAPLRDRLGPLLDRLLEVYRDAQPDRSLARAWVELIGELVFRIPVTRLAEAQAGRGTPA